MIYIFLSESGGLTQASAKRQPSTINSPLQFYIPGKYPIRSNNCVAFSTLIVSLVTLSQTVDVLRLPTEADPKSTTKNAKNEIEKCKAEVKRLKAESHHKQEAEI